MLQSDHNPIYHRGEEEGLHNFWLKGNFRVFFGSILALVLNSDQNPNFWTNKRHCRGVYHARVLISFLSHSHNSGLTSKFYCLKSSVWGGFQPPPNVFKKQTIYSCRVVFCSSLFTWAMKSPYLVYISTGKASCLYLSFCICSHTLQWFVYHLFPQEIASYHPLVGQGQYHMYLIFSSIHIHL